MQAASYPAMAQPALDVWDALRSTPGTEQGLAPMLIDPGDTGNSSLNAPDYDRVQAHFATRHITLGARSDSYYEYMLKQYIMGGKRDQKLLQMYMEAMRGVKDLLLGETKPCMCPVLRTCAGALCVPHGFSILEKPDQANCV